MLRILAWFWVMSTLLQVVTPKDYCRERCPLFDPSTRVILLPGPTKVHFYMCNFGVGILFRCAPGTQFNPRRRFCDRPKYAHAVACRRKPDYEGEGSGDGDEPVRL